MLFPTVRVPALESTSITGIIAAVRGFPAFHGSLEFSFEEGGGYSGIDMSPGQEFVQSMLPLGIEAWLKPVLRKGTKPVFIIEMLIPGIKD